MARIWAIAWKDISIRFRDRNAILLMIVAPLLLAGIIGASFGGMISGSDATPFAVIPTLVINQDEGEMGQQFVDVLTSEALSELLEVTLLTDVAAARSQVQLGEARAAIVIPADFTAVIQSSGIRGAEAQTAVQFYADPSAILTPNIVRGVVLQILNGFNGGAISAQVTIQQLVQTNPAALASVSSTLAEEIGTASEGEGTRIDLNKQVVGETADSEANDINPFAFFAPSMAILFLTFSMMDSTRSILEEERDGTLSRMRSAPVTSLQILLGKVGGVFLTGILQFVVFVIASRFLFNLSWGSSLLGLALMTLLTVLAFTSLGMFIAAVAKDVNQAAILGSVVALVFAAVGGNFVDARNYPAWLDTLSKLTINRWGIEGFITLTIEGGGLADITQTLLVLAVLSVGLLGLALWRFQNRITR